MGAIRYGAQGSPDFYRVQGGVRLHQVQGHGPCHTWLCHEVRDKVLRHQSETSSFAQHPGNTQSVCSLADKGFSPGCCCQRKQGEIHSQDFCCPSVPALQPPVHGLSPGRQRSGHGPSSALHLRNTQPCWVERGKFTQTVVVQAQRPKGMESSRCQPT